MKPHTCPVCNGKGSLEQYATSSTSTIPLPISKVMCNACNGTGIVWEPTSQPNWYPPELPMTPLPEIPNNEPVLPIAPTFEPNIYPLTFPDNFEFSKDITNKTKEDLIDMLRKWIEELQKDS